MEGWIPVDRDFIRDGTLTPYEKVVLLVIRSHINGEGVAWPSFATIAKETKCSRRQIITIIAALRDKGLLTVTSRGDRKVNEYRTSEPTALEQMQTSEPRAPTSALHSPTSEPRAPQLVKQVHPKKNKGRIITKENNLRRMNADESLKLFAAFSDVWSEQEITERIEEAQNHVALKKAKSEYLYLRTWLRRDYQQAKARSNGHITGGLGKGSPTRDVSKFYLWPGRTK